MLEEVYEELEEAKVENEKFREDFLSKAELCQHLKKVHNEQVIKIREASLEIKKQAQRLLENEEEILLVKQANENLKCSLNEKECKVKHLNAAIDKLRVERDEKNRTWEWENRRLLLALDEANEKHIDQEQEINVLKAEIEGLKAHLSVSKKKCLEAEKKPKNPKELREKYDLWVKIQEDRREVEDQLKWRKEQFKHLEEVHEKLRDWFKVSKKEWEQEKSTLLNEISSMQARLDSQIRITGDLRNRLQVCNQALAHEETRRKYLEVEISEFRTWYENIFSECQGAKSQLDCLNSQWDNEVAILRHILSTKESFYKELEHRAGKLEQENQELLTSLEELQKARIQEGGSSSSVSKLTNKLRSVEQMQKECLTNLSAKEAEWISQWEEMTQKLNDYRSQLKHKDATLKVLEMELDGCQSSAVRLKLQNEEFSVLVSLLKSGMSEAQPKLANVEAESGLHEKERVEKLSVLRQQPEIKDAALANAQIDIAEECEGTVILSWKVDNFDQLEDKHWLIEKEFNRCKEMLEESSRCPIQLKKQALQVDNDSKEKIQEVCDALDAVNSELAEKQGNVASLLRRVKSLDLIEGQLLLMQKELDRYKKMPGEASRCQMHLEERVLWIEIESGEKVREVCGALETTKSELTEERERTASLMKRVESLDQIEEQWLKTRDELERYKEMLEEASRSQSRLQEQSVHMKNEFGEKLQRVYYALEAANVELAEERKRTASLMKRIESSDHLEEQIVAQISQSYTDSEKNPEEVFNDLERANSDLVEKTCEGHEIEFELWIWKSIAERLKVDLEESQALRKELEASLLVQLEVEETIKKEKDDLIRITEELKSRELETVSSAEESILRITREHDKILEACQQKIGLLEEESLRREMEGAAFAHIGAERKFEHEKENLLQLVNEKDQRIDDLMQVVRSMEEDFSSSLNPFPQSSLRSRRGLIWSMELGRRLTELRFRLSSKSKRKS